jgi:RNA polymerase sigma-70 factor (ECF subfamily)
MDEEGRSDRGAEEFERLYRGQRPRLLAVARRLARNEEKAEDLVSETFLRAFTHFGRFRGEAAFGTWVHRILVNLLYDARPESHAEIPETFAAGAGRSDPHLLYESRRIAARIDEALGRLSPHQRQVFLMKEFEGERHAGIAARLGFSESTSKVHYFNALKRLKEELHDLV